MTTTLIPRKELRLAAIALLLAACIVCAACVGRAQNPSSNPTGDAPGTSELQQTDEPPEDSHSTSPEAQPSAGRQTAGQSETGSQSSIDQGTDSQGNPAEDAWRIVITDTGGKEIWSFIEDDLSGRVWSLTKVYSTINNWPTTRFWAADGYSVADLLRVAGVYETVQTVTFRSGDGYEASFTIEQLTSQQYCFPNAGENDSGAEPVEPIIAYRWRDGTSDLGDLRDDKPSLVIGQRNAFEHTNPAFVIGISEIIVDFDFCETWPTASTFPLPGPIAAGETVKLQHRDYGLVKLHYTLDGSMPTALSPMYNPSTYQPELNKPIPITEPTIIKVLVTGYGKNDSEIAEFEFTPTG